MNICSDLELIENIVEDREKAYKIMNYRKYNSILAIAYISENELINDFNISKNKAKILKSTIEIAKKITQTKIQKENKKFNSSDIVASYYMQDMRFLEKEQVRIAILNIKNELIKDIILSIGNIESAIVDMKEIMKEVLRNSGSKIIIIHNHPSGEVEPSAEDIKTTKKLKEACRIMDIALIDHIIIGNNDYFSFGENGIIQN